MGFYWEGNELEVMALNERETVLLLQKMIDRGKRKQHSKRSHNPHKPVFTLASKQPAEEKEVSPKINISSKPRKITEDCFDDGTCLF